MNIIDKRIGKVKFDDLKNGDTFLLDGRLHMKVSKASPTRDVWNVYDFEQNSLMRLDDVDKEVIPIKTELHIVD